MPRCALDAARKNKLEGRTAGANFSGAFIFLEGRHLEGMATVGACLRQIGLLDTSVFTACDNIDEEFKIVKKTYHKTILQCVPALPAFCGGKGRLTCMLRPLFTASSTVTRTEILRRY